MNTYILDKEQTEMVLNNKKYMLIFLDNVIKLYKRSPILFELTLHLRANANRIKESLDEFSINTDYMVDNKFYIKSANNIISNYNIFDDYYVTYYIPDKHMAIKFVTTEESAIHDKCYCQRASVKAISMNIRLIHIFEYELDDSIQREKIFNFIDRIVNNNNNIIYARKTKVVEIDKSEEQKILNDGHLQNYVQSSIKYGLEYNNEIVAIMTFGKPRFNYDCEYELIRLAYKPNTTIIGGATKLFKHFIKEHNPHSIISYCDMSKFMGNTYLKLGFKTSIKDITSPNYVWYDPIRKIALPRYRTMKHKLLASGIGNPNQTETEIMQSIGYTKIHDCGNIRFTWFNTDNNIVN